MDGDPDGAAISDGLEDGQVIRGVGGQLISWRDLRSKRASSTPHAGSDAAGGQQGANPTSAGDSGHEDHPRHLRDVFVNEYGVAT